METLLVLTIFQNHIYGKINANHIYHFTELRETPGYQKSFAQVLGGQI